MSLRVHATKSKLCYDRRSVGQYVLVLSIQLWQIFNAVRQLPVCWCGEPSLTRGRVCRLQLLLGVASAVTVGSESSRTHEHILLSQIPDSSNLESYVPVFISPHKQGGPVISPWTRFPFSSSPTTRWAEVFETTSKRREFTSPKSKSELHYDW
jgi:hypothetical protein